MAEGMFGAPVGLSHRRQEDVKDALAGASILETAGKLAEIPSEIEMRTAHSRLYRAQAGEKEQEAAAMQRYLAAAEAGGAPAAEGQSDGMRYIAIGEQMRQFGMLDKAQKYINMGSQMVNRENTNAFRQSQVIDNLSRVGEREAKALREAAGAMVDQPSYEQGLMNLASRGIDVSDFPPDFARGVGKVRYLAESSVSETNRRQLVARTAEQTAREAAERRRAAADEVRKNYYRRRLDQHDEARKVREKTAGKAAGTPSAEERTQAGLLLDELGIKLGSDEEMRVVTFDLAAEAKRLRMGNPAFTAATALRAAVTKAQQNGDLVPAEDPPLWGKRKHKFEKAGKTPELAIAAPIGGKDAQGRPMIRPSDLQAQKYYILPDGRIGQWTGSKMKLVPGALATGVEGGGGGDGDDDDDE